MTLRLSGLYLLKCGHRPEKLLLPVFLTANPYSKRKIIPLQDTNNGIKLNYYKDNTIYFRVFLILCIICSFCGIICTPRPQESGCCKSLRKNAAEA